jgi:hypothetical protein
MTDQATTTPEYSDDFAEFERQMQGGAKVADVETATEETPSEDADASESVDESETSKDDEHGAGEDDKPADDDNDKKPGSKRGLEKRFKDLTSQVRELKAALAAKADTGVASPKADTGNNTAAPGEPKAADFDTYEDYVRELSRYTVRQERAAADQQNAANAVLDSWKSRAEAVRTTHADYDEGLAEVNDLHFSDAIRDALLDSEHGPAIAYEIAKDRAEAERIAKLSPVQAIKEIGAREARLQLATSKAQPKTRVSNAPEPITPTSRAAAPRAVRFDDPDVDFKTFEKAANARFR